MSESTNTSPSAGDAPGTIQIHIKGPSELKLQIDISLEKSVLELKQAIADKSDVEADRQRLIYSGRVLKDEDPLSKYKVQSGHTVHMVKGAARSGAGASSTTGASTGDAQQPLPNMQTGQNVHDPLSQLNSHLAFGHNLGNFNPFADMGVNQNDPNMMANMLNSPEFMQQMTSLMSNPQILDQIIASNPELAAMGPQVREIFQSEHFRQMLSNPDSLRQMMQTSAALRNAGIGPGMPGMPGAQQPSFPAPGAHSGAPTSPNSNPGANANAGAGAGTGAGLFDPNLLAQMLGGAGAGAGGAGAGAGAFGGLNPFMLGLGAGGAGAGAGTGTAQPAANLPPPEERFQVQLQQLQDMGFTNAQQNVRALLATGGNVHGAIEYILSGGGL